MSIYKDGGHEFKALQCIPSERMANHTGSLFDRNHGGHGFSAHRFTPSGWNGQSHLSSLAIEQISLNSRCSRREGNTPSSAAAKTLKDTYANDVVNEKTCRRWFSAGGFKKDDFSLKDERRTESRMLKKTQFWAIASCH
ncbi:hypothetical protein ACTXT7_000553 [Hymenolepis weldensis]